MRQLGLFFILATLVFSCSPPQKAAPENGGDLYVSPASQSDERAAKLLPMHGSEDVRHLLTYTPRAQPAEALDSAKQYFANEQFDWILRLQPAHLVTRQQLITCFDRQWQEQHGEPQLYGRSARDGRWTYAVAGGADTVFSALALGWKLYNSRTESPRPFALAELDGFRQATVARATQLPARLTQLNYQPAQAAARSQQLGQFVVANDQQAFIRLKAATDFKGRAIWNAMLSLGLHWGDMDLFHWDNPATDAGGGDYLFDVYTTTEPGYFLPERIAANEVSTADLVFAFSIPRSAAPAQVLASMYRAAGYCQQKLGGQLVDAAGQPFNLA
ncbi:MAG: hypothetical protein EOO57_14150, partial [Hymenobacter sp.]